MISTPVADIRYSQPTGSPDIRSRILNKVKLGYGSIELRTLESYFGCKSDNSGSAKS
jgi:hypothetical protein